MGDGIVRSNGDGFSYRWVLECIEYVLASTVVFDWNGRLG